MLPRHGEGFCVQLLFLASAVPHLHHGNHADQHLLSGLPGGLFLLHVVWRQRVDAARPIHPAPVGLAHRIHLLRDCHEEPAVCECPHSGAVNAPIIQLVSLLCRIYSVNYSLFLPFLCIFGISSVLVPTWTAC